MPKEPKVKRKVQKTMREDGLESAVQQKSTAGESRVYFKMSTSHINKDKKNM